MPSYTHRSKQVRFFDDSNQFYPSQTSAGSGSPSPLDSTVPLPRARSRSMSAKRPALLHGVLRASSSAGLQWNAALPPQTAILRSTSMLREPATDPPTPYMHISFRHSPHTVAVHASNGYCVTVYDVLHGVYLALQQPLSGSEHRRTVRHGGLRDLEASFHSRCNRFADWRQAEFEKKQGFKRVDLCLGRSRFAGMLSSSASPGTWTVELS